MSRTWKIIFAISGVLVLLTTLDSPVLLPYPLFVLAYLRGWRLPINGAPWLRLLISTAMCCFLLEFGAWFGSYLKNDPAPALLHPQLIPDLIISIGIYSAWWLNWWMILRRYHFTTRQVFITTGLYGVILEQQGQAFLMGLAALPVGILVWLFVFVAYGSTMALAFFLVRDSFTAERESWLKYPLAWAWLFVLTYATFFVWGLGLQVLNFLPPSKMPMRDYPLW